MLPDALDDSGMLDDPVDPLVTEETALDVPVPRLAVPAVLIIDEVLIMVPLDVPVDPLDDPEELTVVVVLDTVFVSPEIVRLVLAVVCMLEVIDTISVLPVVVEESRVIGGLLDV